MQTNFRSEVNQSGLGSRHKTTRRRPHQIDDRAALPRATRVRPLSGSHTEARGAIAAAPSPRREKTPRPRGLSAEITSKRTPDENSELATELRAKLNLKPMLSKPLLVGPQGYWRFRGSWLDPGASRARCTQFLGTGWIDFPRYKIELSMIADGIANPLILLQ